MESSLYSCIQAIQDGDKEQALAFLEKFSPLLKKYAYFLQTEDALQELQCFLLAFVKNSHLNKLTSSTDGAIISYINKTIYHHYIALSKGNRHKIPTVSIEDKSDFDSLQFDSNFGESDTYSNLLLMDLQHALTADEYHVIYDHFFRQYSIQEIAASHKQMQKDCIREITSLLGNQAIIVMYAVTAFQFSGLFRREIQRRYLL